MTLQTAKDTLAVYFLDLLTRCLFCYTQTCMIYSLNMNGELGLSLPPLPPPSSSVAAEPAVAKRHGGDAVINPGRRDLWDPQQQQDADSSEHFPSLADRARASTRHVIKNGLASPTHSAHATFFRPTAGTSVNKVAPDRRAKKVWNKMETFRQNEKKPIERIPPHILLGC